GGRSGASAPGYVSSPPSRRRRSPRMSERTPSWRGSAGLACRLRPPVLAHHLEDQLEAEREVVPSHHPLGLDDRPRSDVYVPTHAQLTLQDALEGLGVGDPAPRD